MMIVEEALPLMRAFDVARGEEEPMELGLAIAGGPRSSDPETGPEIR